MMDTKTMLLHQKEQDIAELQTEESKIKSCKS